MNLLPAGTALEHREVKVRFWVSPKYLRIGSNILYSNKMFCYGLGGAELGHEDNAISQMATSALSSKIIFLKKVKQTHEDRGQCPL